MSVEHLILEAQREARGSLDLSGMGLTSLPPEITRLREIRELFLHDNNLRWLPPEIGQLDHMESLTLHGNQLQGLPEEIRWWHKLRRLTLHGNRLTTLPREFGQISNLRYLSLHNNLLESLPREFCDLIDLRDLYLSDNKLKTLPEEFGDLEKLRTLDLSRNRLERLPPEFGFLSEKVFLKLEGNPLVPPLPELYARSTPELLTYIRSQAEGLPQYEARVLLVGDGNAGKTSLLAALQGEPFVLGRASTHGLNIATLAMNHRPVKPNEVACQLRLNVWDFAGQEIYRTTHQLFFSNRSLYLLVYNARESQQARNLQSWLRQIKSRVRSDVRILLVATHCEEQPPDCEYKELEREFGELLAGHYEVDNRTGLGIPELKAAVASQAAALPEMGEVWNPAWLAARDDLLSLDQPEIRYSDYEQLCEGHTLGKREANTLIGMLHDLGHLIHYDEPLLRDHVILNPEWLANAMSNVLLDEPTRRAGGVLEHSRLSTVWSRGQQVYPRELYPFFLRLMEAFDLSYRMEGGRRSLVAPLVPAERPELPWNIDTSPRTGERIRTLEANLGNQGPAGLLSALTVRFNRLSTGIHWRNGVLLEKDGHQALVEKLEDGKVLRFSVRGPWPDYLMDYLGDGFEHLIAQRWPGVKAQMFIACPARPDGKACPGRFELSFLRTMQARGVPMVMCQSCYEQFPVADLLPGGKTATVTLSDAAAELESQLADESHGPIVKQTVNDYLRQLARSVAEDCRDTPPLFSLKAEPLGDGNWNCQITLFDQQPSTERPYKPATYSMAVGEMQLAAVAPYVELMRRAHRLIKLRDGETPDLETPLPVSKSASSTEIANRVENRLTGAEREGLHAFRAWMLELDTDHDFGGLRQVVNSAGDRLWVSPDNYALYDPGTPVLAD